MPRFLVVTPRAPTTDLVGALHDGNVRCLGVWNFPDAENPDTWLPDDGLYAYVDLATGLVRHRVERQMTKPGNLVALLGYPALDLALTPAHVPHDRIATAEDYRRSSPRPRVDLALPEALDARLHARSLIKAAMPHLTDQDIMRMAQDKRFSLNRQEAVTMLVGYLQALRDGDDPFTARDVFPALTPVAPEAYPSWHPRAGEPVDTY
jgi:hypothetical protein